MYIDPYAANVLLASQYYVVGYKGSSPYDAGMFYCPYVPLQMVRAVGEHTFQPKIGFKTRYGIAGLTHSTQEQSLPVLKVQSQLLRTPTSTTEELKLQTLCNNKKLNETREGFYNPSFFF